MSKDHAWVDIDFSLPRPAPKRSNCVHYILHSGAPGKKNKNYQRDRF